MKKVYNKLIRDNIVNDILQNSKECHYQILLDDNIDECLRKKLVEEAKEVLDSVDKNNLVEEIADVLEVLEAIMVKNDIDMNEVLIAKKKKAEMKGKFDNKVFLEYVIE